MGNNIGARLKSVRENAGLSQSAFGESLGVSLPTINRFERGHRQPDANFLSQLATMYQCDMNWLLCGVGMAPGGGISGVPLVERIPEEMTDLTDQQGLVRISLPDLPPRALAYAYRGEEMLPLIRSGDLVLFSYGSVEHGSLAVCRDEWSRGVVGRFSKTKGALVFDNHDFPPRDLGRDFVLVGPVIEVVRRFTPA